MKAGVIATVGLSILAVCVCAPDAVADGIVTDYSHHLTDAGTDGAGGEYINVFTQSPSFDLDTSASHAGAVARTETAVTATSVTFSGAWTTAPALDSFGRSAAWVSFVADGSSAFWLSGGASAENGHGAGSFRYEVSLYDFADEAFVFYSYQLSGDDVTSESFVLGGPGGTTLNSVSGGLTGTLVDGHRYKFLMVAEVHNSSTSQPGLSGSAWAALTLGSPVPEPTTLALFGLGAGALAWRRRRKRKLA